MFTSKWCYTPSVTLWVNKAVTMTFDVSMQLQRPQSARLSRICKFCMFSVVSTFTLFCFLTHRLQWYVWVQLLEICASVNRLHANVHRTLNVDFQTILLENAMVGSSRISAPTVGFLSVSSYVKGCAAMYVSRTFANENISFLEKQPVCLMCRITGVLVLGFPSSWSPCVYCSHCSSVVLKIECSPKSQPKHVSGVFLDFGEAVIFNSLVRTW